MGKGKWSQIGPSPEINATIHYNYELSDRDCGIWLKKDNTDKKWYVDMGEGTEPEELDWIPIEATNVREAKKVVEVLARMEQS